MVGGPGNFSVQTLDASSVFTINLRVLTAAARSNVRVAWALAEEINRRLYEALDQTAINAFGSVKQRIAAHLLEIASRQQSPSASLAAFISQQELADAVASVREVVARNLRDFRLEGIVATSPDRVVILDAARLHREAAREPDL